MKAKLILIALLISIGSLAQNSINYKALIKDVNGNVLVSSAVTIQFVIYEGVALTNNVYQENHNIDTDSNGFILVNIGEGTTNDDFNSVNWSDDDHFLNVQIDIGSGLVDIGTTQFMAVPYALSSGDHPWNKDENGVHLMNNDVGINRINPEHTLDVRSISQADASGLNVSNNDKSRYIRFFSGSEMFPDPSISRAPGHSLLFATFDDNTFAFNEHMRISSQGNIGVGTNSPSQKLDVNGKAKIGDDAEIPSAGTMRFNSSTDSFEGFNGSEWVSMGYKPTVYSYEQHPVNESYSSTNRDVLQAFPYTLTIEEPGKYMCFFDITFFDLNGNTTTLSSDRSLYVELQIYNQLASKSIGANVVGLPSGFKYYFRQYENIQMHRIIDIPAANQNMEFRFRVNKNPCCNAQTSAYSILNVKMTAIKLD